MEGSRKVKLTEEQRGKVNAAIQREGSPQRLAKKWDIDDTPLLRAANGYAVQKGTRAQIELGLQKEAP